MYEWIKGNAYHLIVTLYQSNMTLNSAAASYFENVRWVMIGFDRKHKKVAVKPVTKQEVDLKLVPMAQLHKISIGKGYGRISNKSIIQEMQSIMGIPLDGVKVSAQFNEKMQLLEIDLDEVLD